MVALVLDVSGSMSQVILSNLKLAAKNFVDLISPENDDRIAIITYETEYDESLLHPLGQAVNKESLKAEIDLIELGDTTCISCGLKLALNEFLTTPDPDPYGSLKFLILMTDGMPNGRLPESEVTTCGWGGLTYPRVPPLLHRKPGDYLQSAAITNRIKREGITIFGVGLGEQPNFGEPLCEENYYGFDPGPIPQNGSSCYLCAGPTPWGWSPEPYSSGNHQWCGGDLVPNLLAEFSNDSETLNEDLLLPLPDGFELPPEEECEELNDWPLDSDCNCRPQLGDGVPQGSYRHTSNASELTPIFEDIFWFAVRNTRLVSP